MKVASGEVGMMVVADADGPVHSAFLESVPATMGCMMAIPESFGGVHEGKYAGNILGTDPQANYGSVFPEAMWGGDLDQLRPQVLLSWPASIGHAIAVSSKHFCAYQSDGAVSMAPWGGPLSTVYPAANVVGGAQQTALEIWGDWATWESGDGTYHSRLAWSPASGTYHYFWYGGDASQGATGLGTDLKDMVWTFASTAGAAVMTAPYAQDPSTIQPKRLRSYIGHVIEPWIVGCGRAAHMVTPGKVMIVRLSDGYSWLLSTTSCTGPGAANGYCFGKPYALTCDELFVRGGIGLAANIARVRFNALGAGMPPD
jgi:hypothetical protein